MPDTSPAGPLGWGREHYPRVDRGPVVDIIHGTPVPDPYRWLEDPDSPETRRWSAEQDRLWQGVRGSLPRHPWWRHQVATYFDVDFASTPVSRGRWQFIMRHTSGGQYPGLYAERSDGLSCNVVDVLPVSSSGAGQLQTWQPSLEGRLVALTVAENGSEQANLWIIDVEAGGVADGPIPGCGHSSIVWRPGGHSLIYSRRRPGGCRRIVYEHQVGSSAEEDSVVFALEDVGEVDTYFRLSSGRDGRWLAVSASDGSPASGNDLWLGDLDTGTPPHFVRVQRAAEGSSGITVGPDGLLYILTDRGAPNRRIMVATPDRPTPQAWRELVGSADGAVVADFAILPGPGRLIVAWTRDGIGEMTVHDLDHGGMLSRVPLPGAGRIGPLVTRDRNADCVWFSYADAATPPRTMQYDVMSGTSPTSTGEPGGTGTEHIVTERRWSRSPDGTRIQMIVVRPTGASGPFPTILCGYGGFGVSMTPTYSPAAQAWVKAGGCYVIANTRGGGERGEPWHAAGRGHRKQAVFDDFIACAETLIMDGLTARDRLAIWGASNGGLLTCASAMQRPDLFAAVVAWAPLCDMIRYEKSGMGAVWRSEYGTADDPEDFRHLLAYSPYHRVVEGCAYPALLLAVSTADERVNGLFDLPVDGRQLSPLAATELSPMAAR